MLRKYSLVFGLTLGYGTPEERVVKGWNAKKDKQQEINEMATDKQIEAMKKNILKAQRGWQK